MTNSNKKNQSYNGMYRGKVLANGSTQDSALGKGKCRIWVPGVYPSEYIDNPGMLPVAEPAAPLTMGVSKNTGQYTTPEINTMVWVFFEGGDHMSPVYFAVVPNGKSWIPKHKKVHCLVNDAFAIIVDESEDLGTDEVADITSADFQNQSVSSISLVTKNNLSGEEAITEDNTDETIENIADAIPGLIVNISKKDGQTHLTVVINGLLNIVTPGGGAFINGLPII